MSKAQTCILVILALLLVVMLTLIFVVSPADKNGAFTPPPFETNAMLGSPEEIPTHLNYQMLQVSDVFRAGMCCNLIEKDGAVDVYATSAEDNTVWIRLVLLDENGCQLGSTGVLKPGEYVQTIALDVIPTTTMEITAKILSYEPETYYSMGSAGAKITLNIEH